MNVNYWQRGQRGQGRLGGQRDKVRHRVCTVCARVAGDTALDDTWDKGASNVCH
jgi:hypothetical protein